MLILRRALPTALLLFAGACEVELVARYDPAIDLGCLGLHRNMDVFLAGDAAAAYEDCTGFYDQYELEVRDLRFRARCLERNELSVQQFDNMLESVAQLRALHRAGPVDPAAADALREMFDVSWSAIRKLELAKKRGDG
jgi:hypothetical protein